MSTASTSASLYRRSPSLLMRVAVAVLRAGGTKKILNDPVATMADAAKNQAKPEVVPRAFHRRAKLDRKVIAGIQVVEVTPIRGAHDRKVMYLHGGGYVNPMVSHHWTLLADLAERNAATVIAPQYQLAPTATVVDAIRDVTAVYDHYYADQETGPLIAGDSAGGGLALAIAAALRERGSGPLPTHLGLFAPWLDLLLTNADIAKTEPSDPTLALPGIREAGRLWAGGIAPEDPRLSPINDAGDLPPTTIFVGDRDILIHDCRRFLARRTALGSDIELHVAPGAFHAFPVAAFIPESKRSLRHLTRRSFNV